MAFDGITMRALVSECRDALTDTRITKIIQPRPSDIVLTCKGRNGTFRLLLSADASLPLAYLTETVPEAPKEAPAFCMLLRKHLSGGRILSVVQPALERVMQLDIAHNNELGDRKILHLYLEVMGKHSNLILCDDSQTILDAIKRIPPSVSSVRLVLPGQAYFIPPQEGRLDLLSLTRTQVDELLSRPVSLSKALYNGCIGIGPKTAQELLFRAGLDADAPAVCADAVQKDRLFSVLTDFSQDIREERFSPTLVEDAAGVPAEFAPYRLSSYESEALRAFDSISKTLEAFYGRRAAHHAISQRSADLRRKVSNLLERSQKKQALLSGQLADTEKKELFRLRGELLSAYGWQVPKGADTFTCEDWHTGQEVTIPLDPVKTPSQNAQAFFDKYGKYKRRAEALVPQLEETSRIIDSLEDIRLALSLAENQADLDAVMRQMAEAGFLRPSALPKAASRKSEPLHFVTEESFHLYVGKNNEQNDFVTFALAGPEDWWFHTQKIHGAHVILKTGSAVPTDRVFEEAAALAAYFSQGREGGAVEVDYVQRKHLKKPAKAAKGFVIYHTHYSMSAVPGLKGLTPLSD